MNGVHYGVATAEQVAGMSGLQRMQAVVAGTLPQATISHTLDFVLVDAGPGTAVFEGRPGPTLLNPMGTVHGGWALTLIDSATGCAAMTTLAPGVAYTTVETKANMNRAITPATGLVRCEGRVIAQGRTIITAEARVLDTDGRLLAHGTSTLLVLAGR
ncbi:MAG: PaaI family thioesterase [Burkholderiales bacterium]|nr:MAG: PaaI family thioesterase [Burkholderiales bacterium]